MKIFYKIIGLIIVIILIGVILITFTAKHTDQIIMRHLENKTISLTNDAMREVNREMHDKMNSIESYAYSTLVIEEINNSNFFFDNLENISSYIESKDFEWINTNGLENNDFVSEILSNRGSQRLNGIIVSNKKIDGYNSIPEMFVTNKYGCVVSSTDKTSDYYQADEDWWIKAKEKGIYLEDNAFDSSSNSAGVILAMSITDEHDNFIGVIKALISSFAISNLVEESYQNRTDLDEIKLITSKGKLIYQSNNTPYLIEDYSNYSFFSKINGSSGLIITPEEWDSEGLESGEDLEDIVLTYSVSKGFEDFSGFDWIMLVENSKETIYPSESLVSKKLFYISLLISLFLILVGVIISYIITKPIKRLEFLTSKIASGDKTISLSLDNHDEFGQLSTSFNKLLLDLRKSENELMVLNVALERRVKERTSSLEESLNEVRKSKSAIFNMMEDINEANENLKSLDKSKSEFLNIVSHELKTPLTAIMAHLGVLEDLKDNLTSDELNSLEAIKRNTHELKFLISNILEISRMEAGKFELTKVDTDIKKLIDETIKNLDILAKQKGLKLLSKFSDVPRTVLLDDTRIMECMNNLLTNAIKFTEKGSVLVSARKDEDSLIVSVKDTGIGIPKDKVSNLFQKFYQVDASISRRYGGTGLGLSITKKIIEAHGGSISAESVEGEGTTFTFKLPLKTTTTTTTTTKAKDVSDPFSKFDDRIKAIVKEKEQKNSLKEGIKND